MISPFFSDEVRNPDMVLERYDLLRCLPCELARLGHAVTVLVHSPCSGVREIDGVRYEFVQPSRIGALAGRVVHRWKPRYGPAYYEPVTRLLARLRMLRPDVVHFFGLTMDIHLARVLRATKASRTPVVVHFHGGLPTQSPRLRVLQRHNLTSLGKVLFTTNDQAETWLASGLGLRSEQIAIVLETSTAIRAIDQQVARSMTAMSGNPVYVSTGRLHRIKDPLTVLRGFTLIREAQPDARLYLYFLTDEMRSEIDRYLGEHADLACAVELCGSASRAEMAAIYSSADILLQASLREWSGLAVLEAMACGCIPVVTRIPSFSFMTGDGRYGRLFEPGDVEGLAQMALSIDADKRQSLSGAVRRHFDEQLSFPALARNVASVYDDVLQNSG